MTGPNCVLQYEWYLRAIGETMSEMAGGTGLSTAEVIHGTISCAICIWDLERSCQGLGSALREIEQERSETGSAIAAIRLLMLTGWGSGSRLD